MYNMCGKGNYTNCDSRICHQGLASHPDGDHHHADVRHHVNAHHPVDVHRLGADDAPRLAAVVHHQVVADDVHRASAVDHCLVALLLLLLQTFPMPRWLASALV